MKTKHIISALLAACSLTMLSGNAMAQVVDCGPAVNPTILPLVLHNRMVSPPDWPNAEDIILEVPRSSWNCTEFAGGANPSKLNGLRLKDGEVKTVNLSLKGDKASMTLYAYYPSNKDRRVPLRFTLQTRTELYGKAMTLTGPIVMIAQRGAKLREFEARAASTEPYLRATFWVANGHAIWFQ